ncbi:MAG TPA: helix-turn-helix domain-containing protein, partial [Actinomycetes bacterium]|nr:helix-turn-helix domain-containing protein [Actinomycetes bacterium]
MGTTLATEEADVAETRSLSPLNKGRRITGDERGALSDELRHQYENGRSIRDLAADTGRSYGF